MKKRTKEIFEYLGAPLKNQRTSWGSIRPDGTIFLRVWIDERMKVGEKFHWQLTKYRCFLQDKRNNVGWKERLEHIELINKGAQCYLVVVNPTKDPKVIADCADRELGLPMQDRGYKVENLYKDNEGDYWAEVSEPIEYEDMI